jgi:hypothetical protein
MIRGSQPSQARLNDPRPASALLALVLTGLGYGTPWVLPALYEEPEVPTIRGQSRDSERVVRIALPAEPQVEVASAPVAEIPAPALPGTNRGTGPAGEPDPLFQVGPAPDRVPRISAGVARELRPPVSRDKVAKKRRKGKRRPCEPDLAEIAQVTDQGYRVEDSLVAFYAGHPRETEKLARTWWNKDEAGERDGFRVGRVRCGTVLHQLGLRSGDAVMAINGKRIQSYTDGLTAYLKVRQKQLFWVDVFRKGELIRIDYLLVADGSADAELMADALDPTALVEQELALAELAWRKRRRGKKAQKRRLAEAAASTRDLGLPGLSQLSEVGELPDD